MNDDRFARTAEFFGGDGFDRIRNSRVAVIGLGGVGSHAAVCLARNGVGELLLVDCDRVTWSSLNRSAWAVPEDIGAWKADSLAAFLVSSCPGTRTTAVRVFVDEASLPSLGLESLDHAVDAIDSLNPKVELIRYCVEKGVPLVSSMGASCRIDPSAVRVGDISVTRHCPLARKVRQYLRRRGVTGGVTCVYSEEAPPVEAGPPDDSEWVERRGRARRRLPGAGALPGMFGYACAAVVLSRLACSRADREGDRTRHAP
ncbi:tRNA threonylcarbamoyladenosine dehydratase [Candidatus Fermentibacteria bacterium]|nr:tRNA threonylcarbamoyladenosine dehydratase [Candidatus Fermentibacteria bacterium]